MKEPTSARGKLPTRLAATAAGWLLLAGWLSVGAFSSGFGAFGSTLQMAAHAFLAFGSSVGLLLRTGWARGVTLASTGLGSLYAFVTLSAGPTGDPRLGWCLALVFFFSWTTYLVLGSPVRKSQRTSTWSVEGRGSTRSTRVSPMRRTTGADP